MCDCVTAVCPEYHVVGGGVPSFLQPNTSQQISWPPNTTNNNSTNRPLPPVPGLFHPARCSNIRCARRGRPVSLLLLLVLLLLLTFLESPFTLLLIRRPRRQQCSLGGSQLEDRASTGPSRAETRNNQHHTTVVTLLTTPHHTTPHQTTPPTCSCHNISGSLPQSPVMSSAGCSVSWAWGEHFTESSVEAEASEATIPVDLLHSSQCGLAAVKPQQQHGLGRSPTHQHSRYHQLRARVIHIMYFIYDNIIGIRQGWNNTIYLKLILWLLLSLLDFHLTWLDISD